MPIRLMFLGFALALVGCMSQPARDAAITEHMPIMQPLGPARRIVQQLSALWNNRQESILVALELDAQHIAMSGLTPEGLSLFDLSYDGRAIRSNKNPVLPASIAPEYIITDLQLVYWPESELQKMLPQAWRLVATDRKRLLYRGDKLQAEVNYLSIDPEWSKNVELCNFQFNYRLQIKTISYEAIPE